VSRYRSDPDPADFVPVAQVGEVGPGEMKCVQVDGRDVVLINLDGTLHAIDNNCPHNGGPLSKGQLNQETGQLMCPWHAWRWDVRSGRAIAPPINYRTPIYRVRVEGDTVLINRRPG
jgi:nitrite reductase/ring-hydroxylating ferredoxin subunit